MTKKEYKELTGENPEDMFGGDWKNEIEDLLEVQDAGIDEARLRESAYINGWKYKK